MCQLITGVITSVRADHCTGSIAQWTRAHDGRSLQLPLLERVDCRGGRCDETGARIDWRWILTHIDFFWNWLYFFFLSRLLNVSLSTKNLKLNFNWLYLEKNGLRHCISKILARYKLVLAFTQAVYLPYEGGVWVSAGHHYIPGHLC